jgi:hypothetical protein
MALIAVLGGLCAVAVVVLAVRVGRLSAQVRKLSSQLAAVAESSSGSELPDAPIPAAAPLAGAVPETASQQAVAGAVEEVPVITRLPEQDDDFDITARRVASVTLARPLIKVASISYGVRRALDDEHRFKLRYAMRQEFRRQRKMRRRRRADRGPSMGWRS